MIRAIPAFDFDETEEQQLLAELLSIEHAPTVRRPAHRPRRAPRGPADPPSRQGAVMIRAILARIDGQLDAGLGGAEM